jgi:hypothetical protein
MKYLYLFTLEVARLEAGRTYEELPSHLTLMSRFWSDLSADELSKIVRPLFARTNSIELLFGDTVELGPKKLTVHMVQQPEEMKLHNKLRELLDSVKVEYQYPQFIGSNHKPHVTKREGVQFGAGDKRISKAAYLIEVVEEKRAVRAKFELKGNDLGVAR